MEGNKKKIEELENLYKTLLDKYCEEQTKIDEIKLNFINYSENILDKVNEIRRTYVYENTSSLLCTKIEILTKKCIDIKYLD